MRRSAIVHIAFIILAAGVAACAESPTAPSAPALAPDGSAPVTGVVSSPSGAAAVLSVSAPDAIDCGGAADVTLTLTGRDEPRPIDVVVMMDASAGIGAENFTLMKTKVNALIDAFSWGSTANRMAIVQFSGRADAWHPFGSPQTASALKSTVNARGYVAGQQSWMRTAMQVAIGQFDLYPRADARKVVMLITDGNPNPATTQNPCDQAANLTSRGIHTFIFGVGANWTSSVVSCLVSNAATQIYSPPTAMDNMIAALQSRVEMRPAVQNVTVSATIPAGFSVEGSPVVGAGSLTVSNSQITWTISALGAAAQTASVRLRASGSSPSGPVLSGISLSYWVGTLQTTQLLSNLGIAIASCDATPPVIAADVTGTMGNEGWYTSKVFLTWHVSDPESPHSIIAGCEPASVTTDTPAISFSCSASSAGGSASATETLKRDATSPSIQLAGNRVNYFINDYVNITCSASDALSGIAEVNCPSLNVPAWSFGPGTHTLNASAMDVAGNRASRSEQFNVVLTHEALCDLTREWVGAVRRADQLCGMLAVARRLSNNGYGVAAQAVMRSFVRTLSGLSAEEVAGDKRDVLAGLALRL